MTGPTATVFLVAALAFEAPMPASQVQRLPEGEAVIRGPGLERPLELTGEPFFSLLYLSGLIPNWSPPAPGQRVPPPPGERLGPRYDVLYSFPAPGQGPVPLVQALYPGSPGGALVHTPVRQDVPLPGGGRLEARRGWWRSPVLADFLRDVALAEEYTELPVEEVASPGGSPAPSTRPRSERTEAPDDTRGLGRRTRVLVGLAALGLLLLLGALGSRPAARKA